MKHLIFTICFVLTCSISQAQINKVLEYVPNYNFTTNPLFDGIDLSESTGVWEVFANIRAVSINDTQLSFDIVNGITLLFTREASFQTSDGVLVWNGNSASSSFPSATIALSIEAGVIRGIISRGPNTVPLGISFIGNSHYVLFEDEILDDVYPPMSNLAALEDRRDNAAGRIRTTCDGMSIYRVIIAYTPEFGNSFPLANKQNEINDFLVGVVNTVNQTYEASGVNVRARLAFTYQTADVQSNSFTHNFRSFIFPGMYGMYEKYDEIFAYKDFYRADVSILLISNNHDASETAGRASQDLNMAIYQRNGAGGSFGVAHEIGHMFGLEHNREEYSWWQRKINGVSWALDNKKAYGFRGADFRTVMSYANDGNQARVNIYADENDNFPDGQTAGDSYAKAREFLRDHLNWVVGWNDPTDHNLNGYEIASSQMANLFAYSSIQATNFIVNSHARVHLRAADYIKLGPGTHIKTASEFLAQVVPCEQTAGFRLAGSHPTKNPKINMDFGSTYPLTKRPALSESVNEQLMVYPNPASHDDDLQIECSFAGEESVTLTIYNANGVEVYRTDGSQDGHFTKKLRLPSGLYFVKIRTSKGNLATKKVVVK